MRQHVTWRVSYDVYSDPTDSNGCAVLCRQPYNAIYTADNRNLKDMAANMGPIPEEILAKTQTGRTHRGTT